MQPPVTPALDAEAPRFNPHPSRRTGATVVRRPSHDAATRFNPHPSRRTGATNREGLFAPLLYVSILTRPGGRVQPYCFSSISSCCLRVSILTRPGGRVQPVRAGRLQKHRRFQSSPVPEDGCNRRQPHHLHTRRVSILTRPGGRVQRIIESCRDLFIDHVSILTRPGGRVQQSAGLPSPRTG